MHAWWHSACMHCHSGSVLQITSMTPGLISGMQRAVGTIIGGLLGLGFQETGQLGVVISMSFLITAVAVPVATYVGSEYAGKLCILTYIIGEQTHQYVTLLTTQRFVS